MVCFLLVVVVNGTRLAGSSVEKIFIFSRISNEGIVLSQRMLSPSLRIGTGNLSERHLKDAVGDDANFLRRSHLPG